MSKLVTLKIEETLWEQFKTVAYQRDTTASAVIKTFIKQYLDDSDLDDEGDEDNEEYLGLDNNESELNEGIKKDYKKLELITDWKKGDTFRDTDGNIGRFIEWVNTEQQEANVLLASNRAWKSVKVTTSSLIEKLSS